MRKLILISAFVLASVSAQAVEAQLIWPPATLRCAAPVRSHAGATPPARSCHQPRRRQRLTPRRRRLPGSGPPVRKSQASRRETDEQKARQIAAQYGISW